MRYHSEAYFILVSCGRMLFCDKKLFRKKLNRGILMTIFLGVEKLHNYPPAWRILRPLEDWAWVTSTLWLSVIISLCWNATRPQTANTHRPTEEPHFIFHPWKDIFHRTQCPQKSKAPLSNKRKQNGNGRKKWTPDRQQYRTKDTPESIQLPSIRPSGAANVWSSLCYCA